MSEYLKAGELKVVFDGVYAICYRNAGGCYGGVRKTVVDCSGVAKEHIPAHIGEYAGKIYQDFLEN